MIGCTGPAIPRISGRLPIVQRPPVSELQRSGRMSYARWRQAMNIGEVCTREVYIVTQGEALVQAAREMLRRHVGAIVVVQPEGKLVRPVGMVTDRDIVREQLSRDADLRSLKVADVMSKDLLTLPETSEVSEAIERMSSKAVRRAPVVSSSGDLVGIVSLDDLL